MKCHSNTWHSGVEDTLSLLRRRFWVVRGRRIVSRILKACVTCKRHQSKALLPPASPALPPYRVSTDYCFRTCGVDFAGPLFVKPIYGTSLQMNKGYICLFTCAASRAVHLELTPCLESDAFIRALKRFVARRGNPVLLVNDNAQTFTSKVVKAYLLKNGIKMECILAASPWWGGFYERLVRSIKLPLKKVVGKAKLTYEEMETMLIEVEGVVNSRPLTYLQDDNVSDPLTPSHLLSGRNLAAKPEDILPVERNMEQLTKRMEYFKNTMEMYWNRFRHEYLSQLREHHMYASKRKTKCENLLKVGDVVIIKEDNIVPRSSWRMGLVESLVAGKDGYVRGANLRSISKEGKTTKLSRPLQKLVPLEVVRDTKPSNGTTEVELVRNINHQAKISNPHVTHGSRERRACAIAGESFRRSANQE